MLRPHLCAHHTSHIRTIRCQAHTSAHLSTQCWLKSGQQKNWENMSNAGSRELGERRVIEGDVRVLIVCCGYKRGYKHEDTVS